MGRGFISWAVVFANVDTLIVRYMNHKFLGARRAKCHMLDGSLHYKSILFMSTNEHLNTSYIWCSNTFLFIIMFGCRFYLPVNISTHQCQHRQYLTQETNGIVVLGFVVKNRCRFYRSVIYCTLWLSKTLAIVGFESSNKLWIGAPHKPSAPWILLPRKPITRCRRFSVSTVTLQ